MQSSEAETLKSELEHVRKQAKSEKDTLERERDRQRKFQEEVDSAKENLRESHGKSAVQTTARIRNLEAEAENARRKKDEIFETNFMEGQMLKERLQKAERAEQGAIYATREAQQEMDKEIARRG